MVRLVTLVPNMVAFVAVSVILVGAVLRVRRRRSFPFILQLVGSLGAVAGTLAAAYVKWWLLPPAPVDPGRAAQYSLPDFLWLGGTLVTTLGFVLFAWGYVGSEIEELPSRPSSGAERAPANAQGI